MLQYGGGTSLSPNMTAYDFAQQYNQQVNAINQLDAATVAAAASFPYSMQNNNSAAATSLDAAAAAANPASYNAAYAALANMSAGPNLTAAYQQ